MVHMYLYPNRSVISNFPNIHPKNKNLKSTLCLNILCQELGYSDFQKFLQVISKIK